ASFLGGSNLRFPTTEENINSFKSPECVSPPSCIFYRITRFDEKTDEQNTIELAGSTIERMKNIDGLGRSNVFLIVNASTGQRLLICAASIEDADDWEN
ncbi:hypothetical protein PFISCL1PPCAC_4907, partial [Pristionchus fissidentatus]